MTARRVYSVNQGLEADATLEFFLNFVRIVVDVVKTDFVRLPTALTDTVVSWVKRKTEARHVPSLLKSAPCLFGAR